MCAIGCINFLPRAKKDAPHREKVYGAKSVEEHRRLQKIKDFLRRRSRGSRVNQLLL